MTLSGMNLWGLSLSNLRYHALASLLNVLVLSLGIAMMVLLFQVSEQMEQRFTRDLAGIDLVVGAKGSPMQLILSSVFHLDIPNGNIPLEEAEHLQTNPLIKSVIPVALGDNFNGFRIVGTTTDYITHYAGQIDQGKLYTQPMEAVLGSTIAQKHGLKPGDTFVGAHGLVNSDDLHSDFPYTVTGVLKPTGTVLDRLVLTPVESVWHVHEHPDPDDKDELEEAPKNTRAHPGKKITALLITYKTPLAAVTLPRLVNESSSMQSASPAFETARLLKLLGVGSDTVRWFGAVLMAIAGLGFFVTLYHAVNDRKYDIALMRALGATRRKIFALILIEGLLLGGISVLTGIALGHGFAAATARWLEATKHITLTPAGFQTEEITIALAALGLSAVAALIPAIMAYRTQVVQILSRGV